MKLVQVHKNVHFWKILNSGKVRRLTFIHPWIFFTVLWTCFLNSLHLFNHLVFWKMDLWFKGKQCIKWYLLKMPPKCKSKFNVSNNIFCITSIYFLKFNETEFVFRWIDTCCFAFLYCLPMLFNNWLIG